MLTHLLVKDLAIVSSLELDLRSGMTALTGETGAGKSILIDALGLALGDKADMGLVRPECERAEVVAAFDLRRAPLARQWLEENALDDGGECLVRRLLSSEGRSRAFINGRPATLQQLQGLAEHLVDIHSQHAHQSLLRPSQQRILVDEYGGQGKQVLDLANLYRRYREATTRLDGLRLAQADRDARFDLLRYQADELGRLDLRPEELTELDQEQRRLRNVGRLQETCTWLLQRLYEGEPSVHEELGHGLSQLDELIGLDARLGETRELLEVALIQVQEAASGLRGYLDGLDLDPARLEQVEGRLSQIHELARRYRVTPDQIPVHLTDLRAQLGNLEQAEVQIAQLQQEVETLHAEYLHHARQVSAVRAEAGQRLSETVTRSMQTLGMAGGRFAGEIRELGEPTASGLDQIGFVVSANPGQPLQHLAKVASGGELSRISLAIQVATAECGQVPSLVFDEVDVGIGGGVAEIVGQLLRTLGVSRQVLCVTHLPQVAAQAHHHLRVRKYADGKQTFAEINTLSTGDRISEIARMLGGREITKKTVAHAKEMIARATG